MKVQEYQYMRVSQYTTSLYKSITLSLCHCVRVYQYNKIAVLQYKNKTVDFITVSYNHCLLLTILQITTLLKEIYLAKGNQNPIVQLYCIFPQAHILSIL